MTPDLYYLALTAGLCGILWMPYIIGLITAFGVTADDYRNPPKHDLSPFLARANRAHLNLVENLPIFTALVLVAHVSGQAGPNTATASAVFFWSRLAHAVVHLAGWPFVRTVAFAVSNVALLALLLIVLF